MLSNEDIQLMIRDLLLSSGPLRDFDLCKCEAPTLNLTTQEKYRAKYLRSSNVLFVTERVDAEPAMVQVNSLADCNKRKRDLENAIKTDLKTIPMRYNEITGNLARVISDPHISDLSLLAEYKRELLQLFLTNSPETFLDYCQS
jgi:hypothetical protein